MAIGLPLTEFTAFLSELATDPRPEWAAGCVTIDRVGAVTLAITSMAPLKPSHDDGVTVVKWDTVQSREYSRLCYCSCIPTSVMDACARLVTETDTCENDTCWTSVAIGLSSGIGSMHEAKSDDSASTAWGLPVSLAVSDATMTGGLTGHDVSRALNVANGQLPGRRIGHDTIAAGTGPTAAPDWVHTPFRRAPRSSAVVIWVLQGAMDVVTIIDVDRSVHPPCTVTSLGQCHVHVTRMCVGSIACCTSSLGSPLTGRCQQCSSHRRDYQLTTSTIDVCDYAQATVTSYAVVCSVYCSRLRPRLRRCSYTRTFSRSKPCLPGWTG